LIVAFHRQDGPFEAFYLSRSCDNGGSNNQRSGIDNSTGSGYAPSPRSCFADCFHLIYNRLQRERIRLSRSLSTFN